VANETGAEGGSSGAATGVAGDGALRLAGSDSPKALADALTEHWTEAVAVLPSGDIERHVRETLNDAAAADDIAETAKDKSVSEDTRLFRVIMRLDPREHPVFMGYELSEQGLTELAAEVDGPFPTWSATAALRIMYTDRVLTLYAEAAKTTRFRELDDRWHLEFEAWDRVAGKSMEEGGPDVVSRSAWRIRARILELQLDTKGDESLRTRAKEAMAKPTVAGWAKDVGGLEGAGIGTLMGVADLGDAADTYDQTKQAEKKDTSSKRRRGALSGFVSIGLILGIVIAVAAFTSTGSDVGNLGNLNSPTTTPSPTKSVPNDQLPVIGTATITKDTPLLKDPKADADVIQQLKKDDRVFQVGHDENGFYFVKLAKDDKVFGWVDKSNASIICPVQCG